MTDKLLFCSHCSTAIMIQSRANSCPCCGKQVKNHDLLQPGCALGLIGLVYSGKTTYLATLHDQLMHSAPEWRVEVNDWAFNELTRDYQDLRKKMVPTKTKLDLKCFLMKIFWRKQRLGLILWDTGGEEYARLDNPNLRDLLLQCRSIMVAILCSRIQGTLHFQHETPNEEDKYLANFFRNLLQNKNHLRKVIALLVGVDVYGSTPDQACSAALDDFYCNYRIFSGVLKNAGISVEAVPISNIGFGNSIEAGAGTIRLAGPPKPYNVLEPLRRVYPLYLSWWRRRLLDISKSPSSTLRIDDRYKRPPQSPSNESIGSVFISYRRQGGAETARLIRSELIARRWRAFLDVDDLGSSYFDQSLWLEINAAENFVLILSRKCLDRCADERDWFRREIEQAVRLKRNIVPILKDGFKFPPEAGIPEELKDLLRFNSVEYSHIYFPASIEKLVSFLKTNEMIENQR